uniref:Uncharacterized protein n=1 Tax=Hucho hucho TaxID=62062 RepID=A0A4W5MNQ5_9TELE
MQIIGKKVLNWAACLNTDMFVFHLGKQVQPGEFGDLVVLTAVDDDQRRMALQAVDKHIQTEYIQRKLHIIYIQYTQYRYNGGTTLHSLQQLEDIYGKALGGYKVLLIHVGIITHSSTL